MYLSPRNLVSGVIFNIHLFIIHQFHSNFHTFLKKFKLFLKKIFTAVIFKAKYIKDKPKYRSYTEIYHKSKSKKLRTWVRNEKRG